VICVGGLPLTASLSSLAAWASSFSPLLLLLLLLLLRLLLLLLQELGQGLTAALGAFHAESSRSR
jgi:hypothetical protein